MTCPQHQTLDYEGHTTKEGVRVERYRCHHRDCPVRALCTRDPKGRQIEVRPHTEVVQAMRQKLAEPLIGAQFQQRSTIIEPRFAQIKQHDGFRRWTMWGLEGVKTQWSLLCATLNLRILYRLWRANHPPKATHPLAQAQALPKAAKWTGRWRNFVLRTWKKWGNLLAPAFAQWRSHPIYLPKPKIILL